MGALRDGRKLNMGWLVHIPRDPAAYLFAGGHIHGATHTHGGYVYGTVLSDHVWHRDGYRRWPVVILCCRCHRFKQRVIRTDMRIGRSANEMSE